MRNMVLQSTTFLFNERIEAADQNLFGQLHRRIVPLEVPENVKGFTFFFCFLFDVDSQRFFSARNANVKGFVCFQNRYEKQSM